MVKYLIKVGVVTALTEQLLGEGGGKLKHNNYFLASEDEIWAIFSAMIQDYS